jgi:hypothetical protein
VSDLPGSGRPSTAVTPAAVQRALSHIRNYRRITTRELFAILAIGKDVVDKIIHQLGYAKVCALSVPRSLTEEHKEQRKIVFSELLARYEAEGEDFLSTIVTSDKTWIHHFQPQTKRQSMEWHHATSGKKTFKAISSASKIMATVFWDSEGVILIDMLPRGQTINFDVYVETLKRRFRRVLPHKYVTKCLFTTTMRGHTPVRIP